MHYYATYPAGAGEPVRRVLEERLSDLTLHALPDGGVEFSTAVPYSDLNLFCLQNVFQVLHSAETPPDGLNGYGRLLLHADVDWEGAAAHPARVKTFRLVASDRNRLVSLDAGLRAKLEKKLAACSGLRPDRSLPDTEYWLLARSEGVCRFLKRLSRHTSYEKLLHPGELHPELAYLLCRLSEPRHTDVFLDPFCGYGSIPLQRQKRFPFRELYAFDLEAGALKETAEKLPRREEIVVARQDALRLTEALPPESVDAIVTDPPWGLYRETEPDLSAFYRRMLQSFAAVLRPGGRLVLLTAGKDEFAAALALTPALRLLERFDVLVSGKKAAIFSCKKSEGENVENLLH